MRETIGVFAHQSRFAFLALLVALPAYSSLAYAAENVLTLEQALKKAIESNPQIAAARETRSAAGFKILQARAGYLPSAAAAVGYKRSTLNSPASPFVSSSATAAAPALSSLVGEREGMTSYDNWSAAVSVNQTIYDFGRTGGAHDAAGAGEQAAAADVRSIEEQIAFAVTQAYFNVLAAQEANAAALEIRKQMHKHLELAQAQVTAGTRTRIDVARAQSDLANANLAVVRAENGLRAARLNLDTAIGAPVESAYAVERPAPSASPEIGDVEKAVNDALERRPEHRSLVEKLRALDASLQAVKSGYYPTLAATGSLGYSGYELGGLVYNWAVGATATWNFFSGFATQNAALETNANIAAARNGIKALELGIRQEIEGAGLTLREAQEKMAPAQALLASAKETIELAEARYAAGAGNIVEVSDAQAIYTQARTGLIQAELDLEVARARVLKSLGTILRDGRTE